MGDALALGAGIVAVLSGAVHMRGLVHADLCNLRLPRQHSAQSITSSDGWSAASPGTDAAHGSSVKTVTLCQVLPDKHMVSSASCEKCACTGSYLGLDSHASSRWKSALATYRSCWMHELN